MGTTTSITYVTETTPPVISYNVPPDLLGLAVTNLRIKDVSPAPAGDTAAAKNEQIIQNYIKKRTIELFNNRFGYVPNKSLPADIVIPRTGKARLLDHDGEAYWFFADDPASDAQIRKYVSRALGHFDSQFLGRYEMELSTEKKHEIAEEVIKDLKKVLHLNYSVWSADTENYHGIIKEIDGKKINGKLYVKEIDEKEIDGKLYIKAQLDIAYHSYRGKSSQGKDGVYIYILSAVYLAEFNPF